jgi:hypothetical protein
VSWPYVQIVATVEIAFGGLIILCPSTFLGKTSSLKSGNGDLLVRLLVLVMLDEDRLPNHLDSALRLDLNLVNSQPRRDGILLGY